MRHDLEMTLKMRLLPLKKEKLEKLLIPNKNVLSSLYRTRTSYIYRAYLDDPSAKKKLIFKKK